eukprot:TRINITY_DN10675_c0_g2_i2.p1 TRINITY_DN10675_c0_g2~~TRINITY_DN10675_c0_g2_i2.p1  ORF type:complete len:819 (+),score=244.41 TRINITY_DN10675_c0_g2_i2:68-2524(+)
MRSSRRDSPMRLASPMPSRGTTALRAALDEPREGSWGGMQGALQDVQKVLALHDREVASLWDATKQPPHGGVSHAEHLDLRQLVLALTERMNAVEAHAAPPPAPALPHPDVVRALDAMDAQVQALREQAALEVERHGAELAALREAQRSSNRQGVADLKDAETRLAAAAAAAATQNTAFWTGLTAALTAPGAPGGLLGDPTLAGGITAMRDAIMSTVSGAVGRAMEELHHSRMAQERQLESLRAMVLAVDAKEVAYKHPPADALVSAVDAIQVQVDRQLADITARVQGQQLSTVDFDRQLEAMDAKVEAAVGEWRRRGDESQAVMEEFKARCNELLQRHLASVRDAMEHNHTETNTTLRLYNERSAVVHEAVEKLQQDADAASAHRKRITEAVADADTTRKEDHRALLQQQSDKLSSMYGTITADVHRIQRETASDLQRCDETAAKLYRVVEEMRGLQQRTLEQYHAQSDEQAKTVSKINRVMQQVSSALKEQITQESDRLQTMFRNDTADVREVTLRLRVELSERASNAERRMTTMETDLDSIRHRLRNMETPDFPEEIVNLKNNIHNVLVDVTKRLDRLEGGIVSTEHKASSAEAKAKAAEARALSAEAKAEAAGSHAELQMVRRQLKKCEDSIDEMANAFSAAVQKETHPILQQLSDLRGELRGVNDVVGAHDQTIANHLSTVFEEMKRDVAQASRESRDATDATRDLTLRLNGLMSDAELNKLRREVEENTRKSSQTALATSEMAGQLEAIVNGFDARFNNLVNAELQHIQKTVAGLQKRLEEYRDTLDDHGDSKVEVHNIKSELSFIKGRIGL